MEEDTKPDVKPDIQLFFLQENPDIKNLQQSLKEHDESNSDSNGHLKPEVLGENLDNQDVFASMVKDQKFDGIEHIKCEVSDENSACLGSSQSQTHNEHLGGFEHKETELNTQTLNCIISEVKTQTSGSLEHVEMEVGAKTFGSITNLKPETKTVTLLSSRDMKYEVQNFYGIELVKSEVKVMKSDNNVHPKSQGQVKNVEVVNSLKCEASVNSYNTNDCEVQVKSQGQVESFGGIEHLKPELSDETFDDVTDEKPCIAALRASVAAYSVNQGRKEAELEPFPNTEMSSQEMLEPHCGSASNAQEADQESVDNCQSYARTSKRIKKCVEHSGKGKSSECPETLNEFPQDAQQKKTTTIKVSQWQQEILHRETSTDGQLPCLVDCHRPKTRSHNEESIRSGGGRCSRLITTPHQAMDSRQQSSSSYPDNPLCIRHLKLSESSLNVILKQRSSVLSCNSRSVESQNDKQKVSLTISNNDFPKSSTDMQVSQKTKKSASSKSVNLMGTSTSSAYSHFQNTNLKRGLCFRCDFCDKTFESSSSLSIHKTTHTSMKPYTKYKCDVCGKRFQQSGNLVTHKRIHTDEKPFKCDICGKEFGRFCNLSSHMRIHTSGKPYMCDVCGEGFRHSSNLTRHKTIHSDEKPYQCDVCGKGFRRGSALSTHKMIHTSDKPYTCDICGKGFRNNSHLTTHKTMHTNERPYQCDVCGKQFRRNSNLSGHKTIHMYANRYHKLSASDC